MNELSTHRVYDKQQSGFRTNHRTLTKVINDLQINSDSEFQSELLYPSFFSDDLTSVHK